MNRSRRLRYGQMENFHLKTFIVKCQPNQKLFTQLLNEVMEEIQLLNLLKCKSMPFICAPAYARIRYDRLGRPVMHAVDRYPISLSIINIQHRHQQPLWYCCVHRHIQRHWHANQSIDSIYKYLLMPIFYIISKLVYFSVSCLDLADVFSSPQKKKSIIFIQKRALLLSCKVCNKN